MKILIPPLRKPENERRKAFSTGSILLPSWAANQLGYFMNMNYYGFSEPQSGGNVQL